MVGIGNMEVLEEGGARGRTSTQLRKLIAAGGLRAGSRLPPEQRLASQLKVARSTLRLVLQELEGEGLLRQAGRFRVVGESVGEKKTVLSDTVVMLSEPPDAERSQRRSLAGWEQFVDRGALDAIADAGLHAMVLNPERLAEERVNRLIEERPFGIVIRRQAILTPGGARILDLLRAGGIHVVGYGSGPEFAEYDHVGSDHQAGSYELARWLIAQGHRRILRVWRGWAGGPLPVWVSERDKGYEKAVTEAGLEIIPAVVVPLEVSQLSGQALFEAQCVSTSGFLFKHVCGSNPVDAIMAISDGWVPHIAGACRLLGKKPNQDIAIVGYDNYWAEVVERKWEATQPLATVDKCNAQMGRALVEILLKRRSDALPSAPEHRLVPPRFVVNDPKLSD